MDNLRSKVNRWLPVLLWMGLIFFLSSQSYLFPYPHYIIDFLLSKAAHLLKYGVLAILLLNQAAHFFEYAVLAVLLHRAVGNEGGWRAFLMGGLYALSDEFHQGFVPGRNADY